MILNLVMIIIPVVSVICAGMKTALNWQNISVGLCSRGYDANEAHPDEDDR